MPQYLKESETALWGWSQNLSTTENIKVLLGKMAICRQAGRLDKVTLELYTEALKDLDLRSFQVAVKKIACSSRQEGEPAFPSLGMILEAMDEAREFFPKFSAGATEINTKPLYVEERKQIGPKPVARLKA